METPEIFWLRQLDPEDSQRERLRILQWLRGALPFANVREVGSTAIEGVIGKQDIDFAVGVPPAQFTAAREILDGSFRRNDRQTQWNGQPMQRYRAAKDAFIEAALKRS